MGEAKAQSAYFIDGYHGGVYGHYPIGQTDFINKMLKQYPDWSINIEIEPESWDIIKARDPKAYSEFQQLFADQSINTSRIEYVNPSYAQSYFFGTSGESNIRQFSYGIKLLRKHFPTAQFTTYSAEEPCFTSSLPYILKSFGFSYASTKNPNTMWGGYTAAYGGELVNWIGPDGTRLTTVPRYVCENLQPGSTWQSISWYNSKEYIQKCLDAGIKNPAGMCIQDASWSNGWAKGPWLGQDASKYYTPTSYKTWRNYIANFSIRSTKDDWSFTQEDVLTSLVWGSQVMQTLAQEVRIAENHIVQAEKMAVISQLHKKTRWPKAMIDEGWVKLLLSQHHDCWIVPYNNLQGKRSWAEHVTEWTFVTNENSRSVIERSLASLKKNGESAISVYNTLAIERDEIVKVKVPSLWIESEWTVIDQQGENQPTQILKEDGETRLLFRAKVPSFGYTTYTIQKASTPKTTTPTITQREGKYIMESDLYLIELNPGKGGIIESLKAKKLNGKEFVDKSGKWSFNELRGYFGEEHAYLSSTQHPATIRVVEQGPLSVKVAIDGKIGKHPFTQTIQLLQGDEKIDMGVHLDWQGNPAIGEPGIEFKSDNPRKAFYDDRYKLLVSFPTTIQSQQIYKDAPFDVCQSRLDNTYFNSWDQIKHVIILNWVDLASKNKDYGMTLFTDHTTSYVHGEDHPLALTLQFSGKGLWGRDYIINRPTDVSYAIMPHAGLWDESRVWSKSEQTNEPMIATLVDESSIGAKVHSLFSIEDNAYELVSMEYKGDDLYIRLFNAQNNDSKKSIHFNVLADKIELIELNNDVSEVLTVQKNSNKSIVSISMPRFGIRTLKLSNPILN
ncbi:alpha-mannosidase [Bacteroidia bacterium]|nr:alpha-mannosidase [Bacteroidia bacterium]